MPKFKVVVVKRYTKYIYKIFEAKTANQAENIAYKEFPCDSTQDQWVEEECFLDDIGFTNTSKVMEKKAKK